MKTTLTLENSLICAIIAITGIALLCAGCATKTRSVDVNGMYVSDTGTLAIGSVEVMASPVGEESAMIRYSEDTAWLSPSTKTHEIKIQLTGTNCVESVTAIVSNICDAFIETAPQIAAVNAGLPATSSETNAPAAEQ